MFRLLKTGVLALTATSVMIASAEDAPAPAEFWPGAKYDPAIPTFEDVLGYAPGEHITRPEDLPKYCDALAASSPDRALVRRYGRSPRERIPRSPRLPTPAAAHAPTRRWRRSASATARSSPPCRPRVPATPRVVAITASRENRDPPARRATTRPGARTILAARGALRPPGGTPGLLCAAMLQDTFGRECAPRIPGRCVWGLHPGAFICDGFTSAPSGDPPYCGLTSAPDNSNSAARGRIIAGSRPGGS